jgi:hypothetical protein
MTMTRKNGRCALATAIGVLALLPAAPVRAQSPEPGGGAIAITGGGATTASTVGALVGGTVVYDVNDRLAVEGQAAWFDRGRAAEGFTANAGVLVNLVPLGRTAVPYAAVGGGLYRASFDVPYAFGGWHTADMPHFYARRAAMIGAPMNGVFATRTFTDPSVTMGGGVRVTLAPHLEVRPDARAIVVLDAGRRHTIGMFGVNLGFRF